jgi:hypothetical protein
MTPEQLKAFGKAAKELMSDPNRKDPVDPFRQPLYPVPARSLEEVHEGMRKHRIKVMMLEYPTMTRESGGASCAGPSGQDAETAAGTAAPGHSAAANEIVGSGVRGDRQQSDALPPDAYTRGSGGPRGELLLNRVQLGNRSSAP